MINDLMIGCIISGLVALVVILFLLLYQIKKYKNEQIKNYNKIVKTCIKSIDIFAEESKKLNKITSCLVKEMQEFKNSEVYKNYKKNGK